MIIVFDFISYDNLLLSTHRVEVESGKAGYERARKYVTSIMNQFPQVYSALYKEVKQ